MAQSHTFTEDLAAWADKKRSRLGEPPTAEQLVALRDGELPEEEAERLRDRLAVDPEWADIYLELKRGSDSAAGMDAAAVDGAWNRLSMELDRGSSVDATIILFPFHRRRSTRVLMVLAATLVCILGWTFLLNPDEYHAMTLDGESFRNPTTLLVPRGAIGVEFFIDLPELEGRVEVRLLDVEQNVIREKNLLVEMGKPRSILRVTLKSLKEGRSYQLVVRASGASPDTPPVIDKRFTPVFEE